MFNLQQVLSEFPIFSCLDKQGLKDLVAISSLNEFKKSQVIYKENDPPDNLYIVITGRVKTYTQASLKEDRVLEYLHKGTCFGIISLLTNQPHSVMAKAANDALIAQIPKKEFTAFMNKHPLIAVEFSKILSRRVKKRTDKDKNIFESSIISVYSLEKEIGKTSYSLVLAKALSEESGKKVIVAELRSNKQGFFLDTASRVFDIRKFSESTFEGFLEKKWGIDYLKAYYASRSADATKVIPLFLSFLTQVYNFIILDLPASQDSLIIMSLFQADSIHLLSSKQLVYSKKLDESIQSWKDTYKIEEDAIKIILREPRKNNFIEQSKARIVKALFPPLVYRHKDVFATLPYVEEGEILRIIETYPETLYARALRRIARELSSVRIGLALGSGAAFALAHIGVLKVLEENKLDVDIVSGSSMGSIIAALWGLGYDWKKIKEMVYQFHGFRAVSFLDIAFPGKSFLRGSKFRKIIKKLFGNYTFYDLKRPILILSFDFIRRQAHVFSHGDLLLREAVLASCSMPGIFEPLKNKQDLFLDGGVLNPLPVGCLVKAGITKILSVNVTPSQEEIKKDYEESRDKRRFNVLDFIFGSIEAMQREFIREAISLSDVTIHPEFKDVVWTDFSKIDYYIEQGEKAALENLEKIKQLQKL